MGCDCPPRPGHAHGLRLSVSSNGSNGLRQSASGPADEIVRTFSILERIEWAATVPSDGSNEFALTFQYPRTDRMGCDPRPPPPQSRPPDLSVSSNGSNGLRQRIERQFGGTLPAFSILERIEWAATAMQQASSEWTLTFSILERIEWAATPRSPLSTSGLASLSVSSNGSNGLRRPYLLLTVTGGSSFSILERIEWAARQIADTSASKRESSFSILERIEWAATRVAPGATDTELGLSVSSNGSNGLRQNKRP